MKLLKRIRNAVKAFNGNPLDSFWYGPVAFPTAAGVHVNANVSNQLSTVFACIRIISDAVMQTPFKVYREGVDGAREEARDHPVYRLLQKRPNPRDTARFFKRYMTRQLASRGNAYALIERDGLDQIIALWPLHPDNVKVKLSDTLVYSEWGTPIPGQSGMPVYEVTIPGQPRRIYAKREMLHLKDFSEDGIQGLSRIRIAREAIAMGIAAERYGATLFANDGRPSVVFEVEGKLGNTPAESREIKKRMVDDWIEDHSGANAHRPAVLDQGAKLNAFSITPDDAQFLETRKFQVEEICRFWGLPPHMVAHVEGSTSWGTGIEQQQIAFLIYTQSPWYGLWESEINAALFDEEEQGEYYVEAVIEGLIKGDIKARYEAYASAIGNGWMNKNEVRRRENLAPFQGGDAFMEPLNMVPVGTPRMGETPPTRVVPAAAGVMENEASRQDAGATQGDDDACS